MLQQDCQLSVSERLEAGGRQKLRAFPSEQPRYGFLLMLLTHRLGGALLALAAVSSALGAETAADRLRENEQHQEQLATEARQLIGGLDVMLGEYARNGLGGEDIATVEKLKVSISKLTGAEMRQVVDLLQQARAIQDSGARVKTAADAFSAQKQIVVSIQRILADHARQQEAETLARTINDFADRQARNLQNGIELGRLAGPNQPENFEAVMQAQIETQRGEQAAIAEELKITTTRVQKFATDPANAAVATRFQAGVKQLQQLQPRAEQAEGALRAGQLFKAVSEEKATRDELRKVSRMMAPRDRGPAALRQAERELAQIIQEQEQLKAETHLQTADTDFAKWIEERLADIDPNRTLEGEYRRMTPAQRLQNPALRAKFDAIQTAKSTQLARMEDEQGELAGKADHVGQGVPEAPEAGERIQRATAAMTEAQASMQDGTAPAAERQQAEALNQLRAAREEIGRRAEEAELLAGSSGDRIRDLERLRAATQGMAKEEAAIAKTPQPSTIQQASLARRAEQIARRTAEIAPTAVPFLQQAAVQAEQARAAMAQNQPGRQQAEQAAQSLTKAAEQIAQELADAQAEAEKKRIADAALAELAALIELERKLDFETSKAIAANPATSLPPLATNQAAIEKRATDFKSRLSGGMIGAVQSLNDAENAMSQATEALKKAEGKPARDFEAEAIARLYDAQANINRAAQAEQKSQNQPFADAAAMAKAANQLAQAMQQVNDGSAALQQAQQQMGQQEAQTAAEAARQAAQAAQKAVAAAQTAQQQAEQANNAAASNQAASTAQAAQQAAQAAQNAAQSAQQIASQNPQTAMQQAQQTAEQAGQAMQSAMQAVAAAQQAQEAAQNGQGNAQANQAAAQQASAAAQAANQAAAAAQRAQQLANSAANAAQAGQQNAGQSMQQAANQLAQAANQAGQAAAQQAGSPAMQQALQQAAQNLANAAGQAAAGQNSAAQQSAQQAAQQLAQASNMAQAAQAGIGQPSAGQLNAQGQGGQMPGQGVQGAGRQPGQGQGSGPTAQNMAPSEGATGYQPGGASEAVQREARQAAIKKAGFLGLPPRERAAIQQSLSEKYPQEFAPMVEQYLLNLANEAPRPGAK